MSSRSIASGFLHTSSILCVRAPKYHQYKLSSYFLHNTIMAESPEPTEPTNVAHRTRNAGRRDSIEKEAQEKKKFDKERARIIKESLKSDYVEPDKRHLGHLLHLTAPHGDKTACIEPMDFQLRKFAGLIVTTHKAKPQFSEEFIDELGNLASEYLHKLIGLLHKYTEVQRHKRPGVHDLDICFHNNCISPGSLYLEYERSRVLPEATKLHKNTLDRQANQLLDDFYAEEFHLDKNDPSAVFHANDQHEVASLIPRQLLRPSYIPDYFPTLPPDYTYQNTGNYMKTITELKQIKLKLVEELRLNEGSLYKLIDREMPEEAVLSELDSDDEDIMSVSGEGHATDVESPQEANAEASETKEKPKEDESQPAPEEPKPSSNTKRFDFVDYAMRRKAAKERAAKKLAAHRKKREDDILLKREKKYSPYATALPTAEDNAFYELFLQKSLKRVVQATKEAHEKKRAKIAELLEERARQEKEQEKNAGSFEFGFAFNPNANVLDESEEEDDVGELDFGDDFKLVENRTDVAGKRPSSGSDQTAQPTSEAAEQKGEGDFDMKDADDDVGDLENELDNALNENLNLPAPIPFDDGMDGFELSDSDSDEDTNVGNLNFNNNNNATQPQEPATTTTFEMNFPPEVSEESEEDDMINM